MTAHSRQGRLPAIDVLRGVAVLAVVITHSPFSRTGDPLAFPLWTRLLFTVTDYGGLGVNLFLVISGFCIHLPTVRAGEGTAVSFRAFWARRLMRLYPPFAVAVLFTLASLVFLNRGTSNGTLAGVFGYTSNARLALDIGSLALLAQNFTGASHRIGNGPLWTLALEEQLYALYFLLLRLRKKLDWRRTMYFVFAFTAAWRIAALIVARAGWLPSVQWFMFGPPRWIEWVIGALAVEARLSGNELPAWCRSARLGVLLFLGTAALRAPYVLVAHAPELAGSIPAREAILAADFLLTDPLFSLSGFIAVNWALSVNLGDERAGILVRALRGVGYWSYSLYLTHQPVLGFAKFVGLRLHLPWLAIYGLRFGTALVAGYLFHRFVERFFMERARARAWSSAST